MTVSTEPLFFFYLLAANVPLFKKKVRGKAYQEKSEKETGR